MYCLYNSNKVFDVFCHSLRPTDVGLNPDVDWDTCPESQGGILGWIFGGILGWTPGGFLGGAICWHKWQTHTCLKQMFAQTDDILQIILLCT